MLDLAPALRAAGAVRRVDPLADYAFAAELACVLEGEGALLLEVVIVEDAAFRARQELAKPLLALEQRQLIPRFAYFAPRR